MSNCELFNSPINQERARERLKNKMRADLGAKVASAMALAQKAVLNPELLTEDEKAFHQKVMSSNKSGNFDNA